MRLTAKEKIAYGLGAVGKDMVYMLSASYVLYYFQDILGVSAIAMGLILMAARVFDAFNDPIMGVVVAKTKTKWGKFRPWLMIGTITNAIILIVMFSAPPSLDGGGLIAYAAVTYILWGITYTMMDIPYWSMIPAFTESGKEREGLTTLARSAAGVGSAIVTILTVMSVAALGNAFSAKESDLLTKNFASSDGLNYTAFVVEVDADQNPTGNVTEFCGDDVRVSTTITGARRVFGDWNDVIYVNSSNADVTLTINGEEIDARNVEFVKGDYEGEGDDQVCPDPGIPHHVKSKYPCHHKLSGKFLNLCQSQIPLHHHFDEVIHKTDQGKSEGYEHHGDCLRMGRKEKSTSDQQSDQKQDAAHGGSP